jgi:hypothetical protein
LAKKPFGADPARGIHIKNFLLINIDIESLIVVRTIIIILLYTIMDITYINDLIQ